jgi:predicted phosphodiesterase
MSKGVQLMRVALLSDLHGNLEALNAVIADMATQGPFDEIVVAGDLVWSGPRPVEVVDRVRGLGAAVIQGNTDAFFMRTPEETPSGKQEERFAAHLTWMLKQLGPERARWLACLPFSRRISSPCPVGDAASEHDLLVVHANPSDLNRPIMPRLPETDLDELLLTEHGAEPDWEMLAFGHIHVPFTRGWRGRLLVDIGSVGLPMDGDQRAAYAVATWDGQAWRVEHRRVYYSVPLVAHDMVTCGMPRGKHFAERLIAATYTGMVQVTAAIAE